MKPNTGTRRFTVANLLLLRMVPLGVSLSSLLQVFLVGLVASVVSGQLVMTFHQDASLPDSSITKVQNVAKRCTCKMMCFSQTACTAVTIIPQNNDSFLCQLTNADSPESLLQTGKSQVITLTKGSATPKVQQVLQPYISNQTLSSGAIAGMKTACEGGSMAILNTTELIDGLIASDTNGVIDDFGIWVRLRYNPDLNQAYWKVGFFFNDTEVKSTYTVVTPTIVTDVCSTITSQKTFVFKNCKQDTAKPVACTRYVTQ
ncbi:uncharacterized protein LOC121871828 isoform X1 [Homarus americanus]|uniref:Apple domain-containing protein n=1 Tax=Homarus americanus TaxID=6706 RepID=A0A8J5MU40_HOMAM|nr:uncharacterized protein LOC121871828 isoform X1 [Homarus americanus]KAG7164450.1 hypothetical protein Hamer_G003656 [Homarus americanus]